MRKAYQISDVRGMPSYMHIYKDQDMHTFILKEYAIRAKNKWQTVSNDIQTQMTAARLLNSFNRLLISNDMEKLARFKYVSLSIL